MVLGPGRAAGKGHLASHPVSTPLATWLQVVCACFPQTESLDTEPARVPDPLVGCGGVVPNALCSFLSAQWGAAGADSGVEDAALHPPLRQLGAGGMMPPHCPPSRQRFRTAPQCSNPTSPLLPHPPTLTPPRTARRALASETMTVLPAGSHPGWDFARDLVFA